MSELAVLDPRAAFVDVGRVTRSFPGTKRGGSVELLELLVKRDAVELDVDEDVAVFSSPN